MLKLIPTLTIFFATLTAHASPLDVFNADPSRRDGHTLRLLQTGKDLDTARDQAILAAKQSIYISTYVLHNDPSGVHTAKLLCKKAVQGLDVRLYSFHMSTETILGFDDAEKKLGDRLQRCGVKVLFFEPMKWSMNASTWANALHEKLLIIDAKTVFTGGNNYGNHYSHYSRDSETWYDLDVEVTGPVACLFQKRFNESWARAARNSTWGIAGDSMGGLGGSSPGSSQANLDDLAERLYRIKSLKKCSPKKAETTLVPIAVDSAVSPTSDVINDSFIPVLNNPLWSDDRPAMKHYIDLIHASQKHIVLFAPYFVPEDPCKEGSPCAEVSNGESISDALIDAVKRGVNVEVITNSPESNDESNSITIATYQKAPHLIDAGVKIYIWQKKSVFHKKGGLFDEEVAFLGSDNFDGRGQNYSSESIVLTSSALVISTLKDDLIWERDHIKLLTVDDVDAYLSTISKSKKWLVKKLQPLY